MYPGKRWVCSDPEECMRVKRVLQEEVAKLTAASVAPELYAVRSILKRLVIAWDADQDIEFDDALAEARAAVGFVLAKET